MLKERDYEISCEKIRNKILEPYRDILASLDNVYIFGAKFLGQRLANDFLKAGYNVLGFVDNNKNLKGTVINGINVFTPDELDVNDNNCIIINASLNYYREIHLQLKNMGFKNVLPYHILTAYEKIFTPEVTLESLYEDYCLNQEKYKKTFDLFEDEKSRMVLAQIIKFRQTYDMELYPQINDGIEKQYFEDFIPYKGQPFVDGGAFDGDTVEYFQKFSTGNYKKIYLFEPDKKSFSAAKLNLAKYPNIEFYQKGISDSEKVLRFDARGDIGSAFSLDGSETIECIALDDIIKEEQAFIKLDIEGAEIDAIKGSIRLIKNNSPLAICVYHKASHIWEIPEMLRQINPNYKFYLRHYTNVFFDTVLYAV